MSEPQEQIESPCIQFDVFRYVRASQAQYGLKHADYKRYRYAFSLCVVGFNALFDLEFLMSSCPNKWRCVGSIAGIG